MSATETQTASTEQPHPPEIRILKRVAAIPLISSSLESINDVLTNNSFTRQPYAHAKVVSNTAYKLTEPIQVRLASLIVRVDGFANKAIDVVQDRYPYPFEVQPQEVVSYVRERKDSTINGVNKAIDDNVKAPAIHVAQNVDHSLTPFMNLFERAVHKLNSDGAGPLMPPDAKYQYQRALALSKTLRENVTVYTGEQWKHLQAHSVLAQKASDLLDTVKKGVSEVLARSKESTSSDGVM